LGVENIAHPIVNIGTYKEVIRELESLKSIYKADKFKTLGTEKRVMAMASGHNQGMYFNKAYFNKSAADFSKKIESSITSRYHPQGGNTIKAIIDHEWGHVLTVDDFTTYGSYGGYKTPIRKEMQSLKTKYTKDLNNKYKNASNVIRDSYEKTNFEQRSAVYEAESRYFMTSNKERLLADLEQAKISKTNIDKIEKSINEFEFIHISKYAQKNLDEFVAEGFSSALNSENPSPYAKEILQIINKYYKK
jgi:hypothetical protein